jgi:putative aminopeptidase FrvX
VSPDDRVLLQDLLAAYGPGGQEDEVREVCRRALAPLVDELTVDAAGNLVGRLAGTGERDAPLIRVMAHMDELSMIVKRVEADGSLRLSQLGTMYPGNFGLGPLTVLGDEERLTAVLLLGSEHTTQETTQVWRTKPDGGDQAMQWHDVFVVTGRSVEELEAAGVHPGTRADSGPVIGYADDAVVYDKQLSDRLTALGHELGLAPRGAVWEPSDSDASQSRSSGQAARAALLCLPR